MSKLFKFLIVFFFVISIIFIVFWFYIIPDAEYKEVKASTDLTENVEFYKSSESDGRAIRKDVLESSATSAPGPKREEKLDEDDLFDESGTQEKSVPDLTKYNFPAHPPFLAKDHQALKNTNEHYFAWIDIPGTNISYPVVKYYDNDFYLHRNFDTKAYSYPGTIFMDAWNWIYDQNLVIYGHNMKNLSMFGNLKSFADKNVFESHPYIDLYIMGEEKPRVYYIFAFREVGSDINSLCYQLNDLDMNKYISDAVAGAVRSRNVEDFGYNQIITLSTCMSNDAKRKVLNGIRIQ